MMNKILGFGVLLSLLNLQACDDGLTCESLGLIRVDGTCVSPDAGADAMPSDGMVPDDGMVPLDDGGMADAADAGSDACTPIDETCNGADDDCDGLVDEGVTTTFYEDFDGDTYGDESSTCNACDVSECPSVRNWVSEAGDCNDESDAIAPDAEEVCDENDNDCDASTDEGVTTTFYLDTDGDGFGDFSTSVEACDVPEGYAVEGGDCAIDDPDAYPGQTQYFAREVIGVGRFDFDCDSGETHEISAVGTVNCSTFPCPSTRRWSFGVPACGDNGTLAFCQRDVGGLACSGQGTRVETARCR